MSGEYRPRLGGVFARWPLWLKAALIKAWFGGAIFYFIGWGLFINTESQLDLTLALGLALGLTTELLINRALIFLEHEEGEYRRFIFRHAGRFSDFLINVPYGMALSFCVAYTYHFINIAARLASNSPPGTIALGGEPILYGLFFMGYDMLFIAVKRLVRKRPTKT